MRPDVTEGQVIQAVVKAAEALLDRSKWMEIGLLTDTLDYIKGHPRLLRSLSWGDDDYLSCVIDTIPVLLGRPTKSAYPVSGSRRLDPARLPNLAIVEDYLNLPVWLQDHEPNLYGALYGGEDGAVLDELQAAAVELGIQDVDEHAARIRRGLRDDPAQAIGSSKELLETVFKAILDLHGNGPETKQDIPQLLHAASRKLGFHPGGHRDNAPGAEQRRRLFGALTSIVSTTAELRNSGFGTGHGGTQRPQLDIATARLVVSAAVAVATFYLEAHSTESTREQSHGS